MLRLYNTAILPLRALAPLWGWFCGMRRDRRSECAQRLGRELPAVAPRGVWIHGSSVGEARIVVTLARELRGRLPGLPLSISAFTRTGRSCLDEETVADCRFFLPFDFPPPLARLLERVDPRLLVLVETEMWPNLLHESLQRGVRVVVINGRLSAGRMWRYRRLRTLYRPLLERLTVVAAQSDEDARRFVELGVPEAAVRVTGNIKYDLPPPDSSAVRWRERIGWTAADPVFVAGSTGRGEEPQVLAAFRRAVGEFDSLRLVLAPRHPERAGEVERLCAREGWSTIRLSRLGPRGAPDARILLVDSLGELAGLYELASIAFVGGSLVAVGGHNLLEPAAIGVPVLFGPHTQHVAEPAEMLQAAGGGMRVADGEELGQTLRALLGSAERRRTMAAAARSVVLANRGSLERTVHLVIEALDDRSSGRPGSPT